MRSNSRVNDNPSVQHFVIRKNKYFPNSTLPLVIYKGALMLPKQKNRASEITQKIFNRHDWSNSWTNGIYDFHHYHSITHECLAITMGEATVMFGGPGSKKVKVERGDVILIPAGMGHKCISASADFVCVGAYPQAKDYDINYGIPAELKEAVKNIKAVPIPKHDPVFGDQGFLKVYWK